MLGMLFQNEANIHPKRKRWTREECHRLSDRMEIPERYELIDGMIFLPSPTSPARRITSIYAHKWLAEQFGYMQAGTNGVIEIDGEFGEYNEPEIDILVTSKSLLDYFPHHPAAQDSVLVIEVSGPTLWFDMNVKALLYARAGIAEYWVMDVMGRQILRHRKPGKNGYRDIVIFGDNERIAAPGRSETARVGELFAPLSASNE